MSAARLVTLTGVGGVGKTRLAIRSALHSAISARDGAWLVELAPVSDLTFVAEAIASVLRVPEQTGREPEEALARFCAERELLVVLDNCEHVLDALAPLVARLLPRAPGLRIVPTSREPLGVIGEVLLQVSPLPVLVEEGADLADLSPTGETSDAVTLIAQRVAAAAPGLEVTAANRAAICGVVREGWGWLTALVDAGPEPSRERLHAQAALVWVAIAIGAVDVALRHDTEALALAPELAPELVPRLSTHRAFLLLSTGDPSAVAALEDALSTALGLEDQPAEGASASFGAAFGFGAMADAARSGELFADSARICTGAGDVWWLGVVRVMSGFITLLHGDLRAAEDSAIEGIECARSLPDVGVCASGLTVLALRETDRDARRASYLWGMTDRYWHDAGGSMFEAGPWAPFLQQARQRCREELGDKAYEAERGRGWGDPVQYGVGPALGETEQVAAARQAEQGLALTKREEEIAALVAHGLSTRDIAGQLFLSPRTVETHVQHILSKGGFRNRGQIAAWYTHPAGE